MRLEKGTFGVFPAYQLAGLTCHEQIVLCWIWFHKNQEGYCWPSYATLAKEAAMSRRKIIQVIESLVSKKLIQKSTRYQQSCVYKVYLVQRVHQPSARHSPGLVTDVHTEPNSPEPNKLNQRRDRLFTGPESIKSILGRRSKTKA